jgi:hypothetical protein
LIYVRSSNGWRAASQERAVPQYFFNVHGETSAIPDLVGRKLPDDEAARAEGKALADEVAKLELANAFPENSWIEILDDDLRPVAVLPVSETAADPSRTK